MGDPYGCSPYSTLQTRQGLRSRSRPQGSNTLRQTAARRSAPRPNGDARPPSINVSNRGSRPPRRAASVLRPARRQAASATRRLGYLPRTPLPRIPLPPQLLDIRGAPRSAAATRDADYREVIGDGSAPRTHALQDRNLLQGMTQRSRHRPGIMQEERPETRLPDEEPTDGVYPSAAPPRDRAMPHQLKERGRTVFVILTLLGEVN